MWFLICGFGLCLTIVVCELLVYCLCCWPVVYGGLLWFGLVVICDLVFRLFVAFDISWIIWLLCLCLFMVGFMICYLVGKWLFDLVACCFAGAGFDVYFSLCWLMWFGVRLWFRFVCWCLVLELVIYCVIRVLVCGLLFSVCYLDLFVVFGLLTGLVTDVVCFVLMWLLYFLRGWFNCDGFD